MEKLSKSKLRQIIIIKAIAYVLFAVGFIGFIISVCMERHYEIKLFELNQRLRKDERWRKKHCK